MNAQNLQQWISHPESLNRDTLYELRTILAHYPYFQSARLLYLKNLYLLHDLSFGQELRKAALYVADRRVLFNLIEGDKFVIESKKEELSLMKDEPNLDRTLTLIDSFLSSLPEEPLPVKMEYDLSTDYTTYLLEEDSNIAPDESADKKEVPTPKFRGQELIDGFIEKAENEDIIKLQISEENEVKTLQLIETVTDENEDDESYFTETLAKIYVKQQRYSKALEIIKKLSLKYPKKNAYFADQIRFLEKLIINAKSK
nr:tetratricopeptide repeat protein [uncultured Bacteroides sp.]